MWKTLLVDPTLAHIYFYANVQVRGNQFVQLQSAYLLSNLFRVDPEGFSICIDPTSVKNVTFSLGVCTGR